MGFIERMRRPANDTPLTRALDSHPEAITAMAFAFALLASAACHCYWDNDIYYIIALGRSIIESGIPTTDPLTCNEGLDCVAQQWFFCVMAAGLFDASGKGGVCAAVGVVWALAAWALLRCAKAFCGGDSRRASIAAAAALLCLFPFVKTNPRGIDVLCLSLCALAMERFLQGRGRRWLAVPVACSAAMANLHCSMWVLAAAPGACALLDGRAKGRRRALACALLLTCAASAASPYGAGSTSFIFKSLAAPGLSLYPISELQPMTFTLGMWFFSIPAGAAIAAYIALAARGEGGWRPALADWLFLGFAVLALSQVRNCVLFGPVAAWAVASRMKGGGERRETSAGAQLARTFVALMLVVCLPIFAVSAGEPGESPEAAPSAEGEQALVLEALAASGLAPGDAVGNTFGTGGFLEMAGYKPLVDERAELMCPEVNGGTDLVTAQSDLLAGRAAAVKAMLSDGRWSAIVVDSSLSENFEAWAAEHGYAEELSCERYAVFAQQRED